MNIFQRIFYLFTFVLLIISGKIFSQVSFESETQLIAQADKLFASGDYVNAMPLFSQLLSLHPKNPNYNYKFGVCVLHNDEDKAKSLQYFDVAVKDNSVEKEAFFYAGKSYQMNVRFDEAIVFFEKYKSKLGAVADPLDAQRFIQQCRNGKTLYNPSVHLQPVEKFETLENEFYRNYDLKSMKGRIIPKPLNFKSKQDKKVEDNTLIFVGTENQSIVYSGYNDEGTNTSRDLFRVNKLPNGEWSLPQNVGATINTLEDEEFAFLHPDGKTLYFSSKGHNTMGGYDIFRSVYDKESGKWSIPENLAGPVNTPADDIFYATDADANFAYFATKYFTKPGKVKVYKINIKAAEQAGAPILVKGKFNLNNERIYSKAEIKITDKTSNQHVGTYNSNRLNGNYLLMLQPGKTYIFEITPQDFVSHKFELAVPAKASQEFFEQKINLQKDATGETLIMTSWFDATGKSAGNNLRSYYTNEQLAEKSKSENKKVMSPEDFTAYRSAKAEEEKQYFEAQKKALAEIESNRQEALLKAEAEKKAAEEAKLKAEREAAEKAEAEKRAEEEKRKAEELAKAKAEQEKQAAAQKAEEEKRKAEELAKAKQELDENEKLRAEVEELDRKLKEMEEAEKLAKEKEEQAKVEEEKQKAEGLAKANAEEEMRKAAEQAKAQTEEEKRRAEEQAKAEEAERERIEYEKIEANRVAAIDKQIAEKERRLKELLEKAKEQNQDVQTKHKFKTDSLTAEQQTAYEKIQREQEENRRRVEEQVKQQMALDAQKAKEDEAAKQKFLAEKAALEKAEKEKAEKDRKALEEQKLREQQAAAEVERKNKSVMDSIALAQKEKEKIFTKWVDSLDYSDAKESAEKAAAEAEQQRLAYEKTKAEMEAAEKIATENASLNKEKQQQEEFIREQEIMKANLDEQKRLLEEALKQEAELKKIEEALAVSNKEKEEADRKAAQEEKHKAEELAKMKEEEKRLADAAAAKAADEKRKAEEAQRIALDKQKTEPAAKPIIAADLAIKNIENESPEQRKLRLLLQRMNAEALGREILENNMKMQQQFGNETLISSQRYKEAVAGKEVYAVHKKEEKIRPPFDKTDLLSHKGVVYKIEIKLPPVKLPAGIAALLKPTNLPSEESIYHQTGVYTSLAEATLDKNDLVYKGFSANVIAYLNGQEISINDAKKQPVE